MSKASIAVVDDDPSMRTYLLHLLGDAGYAVNVFTNGDQLLDQLNLGQVPSLVLMDVVMPDKDGLHMIESIINSGVNIPVIMLSGMTQVRTVVQAMKLGASDFLLKPVDENVLLMAIKDILKATSPHIAPPAETPVLNIQAALRRQILKWPD